ncbi:hypothetical protein D3C73_831070 [compost metagenome]
MIAGLFKRCGQILLNPLFHRNLACGYVNIEQFVGAVFLPGARLHPRKAFGWRQRLLQLFDHLQRFQHITAASLYLHFRQFLDAASRINTVGPRFQHISRRMPGHTGVIIRGHRMNREAHKEALRLTRLEVPGFAECRQHFGRLSQLALRCFVIDLDNLFSGINGSCIGYVHRDFNMLLTVPADQLGFFRLDIEGGIRYPVAELEMNLFRAEGFEITVAHIDIFLIEVFELIAVICS